MTQVERRRRRPGITVTGHGSAPASVDKVRVTLAITVTRTDAGEAFQSAARTATRVLAVLADDGVDSRSVRTADLSLGPQVDYRDGREHLVGYQAGQRLVVQLEGLAGVERMLTDVAALGGEGVRIDGVNLTPSNPIAALAQARAGAFSDALAKASHLAGLAGRTLGSVEWIDDRPEAIGPQHLWGGEVAKLQAVAMTMPIAAGDSVVSSSVTAHWEFGAEG